LEKKSIDTPIAELGFTGIAVGSAMNGCRPIVEYMTLISVLFDQIINNAAKCVKMTGGQFNAYCFRGPTASAGQLGSDSQALENWFANTPVLVVVPSTVYDAKVFEISYS
jgi:pyruvate dehydrogenase E1 component beta subunit